MSINRRSFLGVTGAAAVILMAGGGAFVMMAGGGAFVMTRSPTRALAPWSAAGKTYADPRLRAVSYAILAPNPHNRQPWIVDLRVDGEVQLLCDTGRLLLETDPYGRQIMIGLGCFLELLTLAAEADGYRLDIVEFPQGISDERIDGRPIASIRFIKSSEAGPDPLFHQIPQRRTNKEPFDTSIQVTESNLRALAGESPASLIVGTTNATEDVARLRDLTWRAHMTEMNTPRTSLESVRLMRIGKSEIEANPDGIDLGGAFLETLNRVGVLTREELADPESSAFQQGLDMYREITGTAMAYLWLTTDGNSRRDQLAAGRAWVRINLKATELGIAIHPLSQSLQEYAEVQLHFDEVHALLGAGSGQRVQMLGRLGYGPAAAPSPRWPLETRILET